MKPVFSILQMFPSLHRLLSVTLALAWGMSWATAYDLDSSEEAKKSYRLMSRDLIAISVYDEPDLAAEQRIDGEGGVRLPLLGDVSLAGITLREGEKRLEEAFVEKRLLVNPQVTIHVLEYAPRMVSVLGEVNSPGPVEFPVETVAMDIIDVISRAGDFTSIAKADAVKIRRSNARGEEATLTVDVTQMMRGGKKVETGQEAVFLIFPDDVIFVPERIF